MLLTEESRQSQSRFDFLPDDVLIKIADKIQDAEYLYMQKIKQEA